MTNSNFLGLTNSSRRSMRQQIWEVSSSSFTKVGGRGSTATPIPAFYSFLVGSRTWISRPGTWNEKVIAINGSLVTMAFSATAVLRLHGRDADAALIDALLRALGDDRFLLRTVPHDS